MTKNLVTKTKNLVTKTGYYRMRCARMAYVIGIVPKQFEIKDCAIGIQQDWDGKWANYYQSYWQENGRYVPGQKSDEDLVEYIGETLSCIEAASEEETHGSDQA